MLFTKGKDVLYALILSRIQVHTGMILTGSTVDVARDDNGADESVIPFHSLFHSVMFRSLLLKAIPTFVTGRPSKAYLLA